jgi:hypothetical protein
VKDLRPSAPPRSSRCRCGSRKIDPGQNRHAGLATSLPANELDTLEADKARLPGTRQDH